MVIEELELTDDGVGRTGQHVRVRGRGRAAQAVEVRVPTRMSPAVRDDATAALPLVLLLAMRVGEDLDVAGRVDPDLYARLDLIQFYYRTMDPTLRLAKVNVAGLVDRSQPPAPFAGVCLSRGVDSMYACARGRSAGGPIDCAVFVDGLEPIHDTAVRRQELALAQSAAEAMGLPLVVVEAPDLRTLTDPMFDWDDANGAGLAWIGHAVAGGLSRLVLASADSFHTVGPSGSNPVLDPLFSSRRLQIEHGELGTRLEKISWLARNRPDLLPLLKVCYAENRSDNCGQCLKCLHTMTCLRVAGALEQATGFPPSLDLEALEALTPRPQPFVRHSFAELRNAALELGDRELAAALTSMIERTAAAGVPDQRERDSFRITHMNAVATLVRTWSSDCGIAVHADRAAHIGLLRTVDLRARRHSYAIGGSRADALTAELGALIAPGCGGEIPVWTLADGRVVTDRYLPPNPSVGGWARARFCVLPLRAGQHPLGRRIRLALRRVLDAFLLRPPTPARLPESGNPVGSLFEEPSEGRLPLWSGVHPVLADQLLTWSSEPLERAGYVDACLLGYLVATAPHTGRLGTESPPLVPWVGAGEIIEDRP